MTTTVRENQYLYAEITYAAKQQPWNHITWRDSSLQY